MEDWAATYLMAFYGDKSHLKAVMRVLEGISEAKEVSLMLARLNDEPVGCLALFRSDKICGVYCVGTLPDFRKMNVASTMLDLSRQACDERGTETDPADDSFRLSGDILPETWIHEIRMLRTCS